MTTNKLAVIVEESNLAKPKAKILLDNFSGYFDMAAEWEAKARTIKVTDESQVADMKIARTGRLFLKGKRLDIERTRKQLKEQALREGKAIDGIANILKGLIIPIEEYLEEQEKFVELKREREAEIKRLEAEKKAERERKKKEAEARKEQERIRKENERLKKEAEERERILEEERKKREQARQKAERERQAKLAAQRKVQEEKERKERETQARKQAEEERKIAEKRAEEERKRREEAERRAEEERKKREAEQRKAEEARKLREAEERKKREALIKAGRLVKCPFCRKEFNADEAKVKGL